MHIKWIILSFLTRRNSLASWALPKGLEDHRWQPKWMMAEVFTWLDVLKGFSFRKDSYICKIWPQETTESEETTVDRSFRSFVAILWPQQRLHCVCGHLVVNSGKTAWADRVDPPFWPETQQWRDVWLHPHPPIHNMWLYPQLDGSVLIAMIILIDSFI